MSMFRLFFSSIRIRSLNGLGGIKRTDPRKGFHSTSSGRSAVRSKTSLIRSQVTNSSHKGFHSTSSAGSAKHTNNPLIQSEVSNSSSWRQFVLPGAVLSVIGSVVFFIHYNDERRSIAKGKEVKFVRSSIEGPIVGGPFCLIDTGGNVVTERNFLGNWVLLYFGYTSSPDVCPAEVQKMAKTVDILESKQHLRVLPIFVTIDPQRDTVQHLRAYLKEFSPTIVGLTGPVTSARQMAQEYRVFFRRVDEEGDDYLVESSHHMYLLNPNMQVMKSFGVEYNAEELSDAITKELKKYYST